MNAVKEAKNILDAYWYEDVFPVDPIRICRSVGLQVLSTELPESVSGALIKDAGKDPIVVLDRNDSNNRKRFSCSHELGHYVSRVLSNENSLEYEFVDFRDATSANGSDPEEIFANQFAANLLMPSNEVKKVSRTHNTWEMAAYFGVSVEAMRNRLKNLGLS